MYDIDKCKQFLEQIGYIIDEKNYIKLKLYNENGTTENIKVLLNKIVNRLNGSEICTTYMEDTIANVLELNEEKVKKNYNVDELVEYCKNHLGLGVDNCNDLLVADCSLDIVCNAINETNSLGLNDCETVLYFILKYKLEKED